MAKIRGALNVAALTRAVTELVGRHEILRSVFAPGEGQVVQLVQPPPSAILPLDDVSDGSPNERIARAGQLVTALAGQPFDLSRGPLFRTRLIRLGADDHWFVMVAHHTVIDGWSADIVRGEIAESYRAAARREPAKLAAPPLQFGDYALAQERQLAATAAADLDYWRQQLTAAPELINLRTDRPRPAVSTRRGDRKSVPLPPEVWEQLNQLSRRESTTLFMTLLAASAVLLARYNGETDLVIGTPSAGRENAEFSNLIGYTVNMLPIRTDLADNPSFRALLRRVKATVLGAFEHQNIPFEKLVRELRPSRNTSYNPIFQVVVVLEHANAIEWSLDGLEVVTAPVLLPCAKFDLTVQFRVTKHGPELGLEYSVDLFSAATIERMLDHLKNLLGAIVARPDANVCDFDFISARERQLMLEEWNPSRTFPPRECVHEIFETQAGRIPHATAVTCVGETLTYDELNRRANQLAHSLRRHGVGPDVLVAICLERSPTMLVGMLGILKAGGAYLPLDPTYPAERIAFVLDDAKPALVLTEHSLIERLPSTRAKTVCLDADWPAIANEPDTNPAPLARPEHLAYVIYTSGSTGRPKGSLITHHNVVRLFEATAEWFHFDNRDVWTLFHSFAFDFSVWEIWGALLYGGRLVIVPHLVTRSPAEFYQLLHRERVTVLNQTPSAFRQLIAAGESQAARDLALRFVIFGGEALDLASLKPWFDRHGDARPQLVNMYGITETTVHVTYRPLRRADLVAGSVIGRPIPDLQIYLLDPAMRPVPLGLPGEIHVGGAGLARGYLNRPELTAERFVPDPFRRDPAARLYRSGDLARWLPDGELEYLGRIDDQVKIRGFRIEPGEIESVLSEHPGVGQCTVLARDAAGGKRLVAYFIARDAAAPSVEALRQHLRRKLPDYMVPAAFVRVTQFPLTAHGKIDRRRLPEPDTSESNTTREFVAATSALEKTIAETWREVLQLERVGVRENFFDLGGDSLSLVTVQLRLQAKLSRSVSVVTLFQFPTIEALARHLESQTPAAASLDPIARRAQLQREARLRARPLRKETGAGQP